MGWIISQAMVQHCENLRYSQGQVAGSLAGTCWAGAQSAPSSGNPTPQAYLSPDKMKAFSRLSRSGMTCKLLTDGHGEALLMSFLAASRVRTLAARGVVPELPVSGPGSGGISLASFAKWDHDSRSWKTRQCSLLGDSTEFSETWPRTGYMCGGRAYELPTSVPRTSASGCSSSSLLPTPTTQHAAVDTRDPHRRVEMGKQIELSDAVRMLPTPRATDCCSASWRSN